MPEVLTRLLTDADAPALLEMLRGNRDEFRRSEPAREDAYFTLDHQRELIAARAAAARGGEELAHGVFLRGRLVGLAALTGISRGAFLNGTSRTVSTAATPIAEWATAAVRQMVTLAWELGLHRVQAAVLPDNHASLRVLGKLGSGDVLACHCAALRPADLRKRLVGSRSAQGTPGRTGAG